MKKIENIASIQPEKKSADLLEKVELNKYFEKIDEEFGLVSDIFSHNLKRQGKDIDPESIVQAWLQDLADLRSINNETLVQNEENDCLDLKNLLIAKFKLANDANKISSEDCYTNKLMLLVLGGDDLKKDFLPDSEIDKEDILDVSVNEGKKRSFYKELKDYLLSTGDHYKWRNGRYLERIDRLDADAVNVFKKLDLMDFFYQEKYYYSCKTLPSFVADDLLERGESNQAFYAQIYPKFEFLSEHVLDNLLARNNTSYILNDFPRFKDIDALSFFKKIVPICSSFSKELLIDWVNKNIDDSDQLLETYDSLLRNGIFIEEKEISEKLNDLDKINYTQQRDALAEELEIAAPSKWEHRLDNGEGAKKLIESSYAKAVIKRVSYNDAEHFDVEWLREELAKQKNTIALCDSSFEHILGEQDYFRMIEESGIDVFASLAKDLRNKPGEEIAFKLIDKGYEDVVLDNINWFSGLSEKMFDLLIERNKAWTICDNILKFEIGKEKLVYLIDNHFELLADHVTTKYLAECDVLNEFTTEGIRHMDKVCNLDFGQLSQEDQEQIFQKYVKAGFGFRVLTEMNFRNLDVEVGAQEFDLAVEKKGLNQGFFEMIKKIPEDSFYKKNFARLEIGRENSSVFRSFMDMMAQGAVARNDEDLELFFESRKILERYADDKAFFADYLKLVKGKSVFEREALLPEMKLKASEMARNIPQDATATNYKLSLSMVYPRRDYDSQKNIDLLVDHSEHLKGLKFKTEGEKFLISGVSSYRLKNNERADSSLLEIYKKRIADIKNLADAERLMKFLELEITDSKTKTLEGKILEYLDANGYNSETLNVVLAYQLKDSYDQFVNASADRLKDSENDDSRNYIMLDELTEKYGDNLKETIKTIKNKLIASEDKNYLSGNLQEENEIKLQNLGVKIKESLKQIPSASLSDAVISKKIKKSLENLFQSNEFIKRNSDEIAQDFRTSNFESFADLWEGKIKEILPILSSQNQLTLLEKAQSKTYQEVFAEMSKYEEVFEVDSGRGEKKLRKEREITGYFGKNKENSQARMIGDICLATSSTLWNDEKYFEFVMFDQERNRCMGTVMLKTLDESKSKRYLLFCPNPSVGLVSEVSAKKLYHKIKDIVINFAVENDYSGVVLDKQHGHSTNRAGLFQQTLESSVLKDDDGEERVINLNKKYPLGSYEYEKNLRAVYLKENS